MPSLIAACEELFETKDLYAVLGVEKSANSAQIKKGYHKVSLSIHPDRVKDEERELATRKFQCVGAVYAVLSDTDRRGLYDETGEIDDENDPLQENKDWADYWRLLFPKITLEAIKEFEKEYKGSLDEKEDIKAAYIEGEGDMAHILDCVLLCTVEDEDRFREIIDEMIKKKEVKKYKAYTDEDPKARKARKRAAEKEAKEAEEAKKELGLDESQESLRALIAARQAARGAAADSFLDNLAEKYGAKGAKKTKKGK